MYIQIYNYIQIDVYIHIYIYIVHIHILILSPSLSGISDQATMETSETLSENVGVHPKMAIFMFWIRGFSNKIFGQTQCVSAVPWAWKIMTHSRSIMTHSHEKSRFESAYHLIFPVISLWYPFWIPLKISPVRICNAHRITSFQWSHGTFGIKMDSWHPNDI